MGRYTQEQKEEALNRVREIGIAKASEELHISVQTLYKWRNEVLVKIKEERQTKEAGELDPSTVKALIDPTVELKARVEALEAENMVLRERNEKMRTLLESMLKAITNA